MCNFTHDVGEGQNACEAKARILDQCRQGGISSARAKHEAPFPAPPCRGPAGDLAQCAHAKSCADRLPRCRHGRALVHDNCEARRLHTSHAPLQASALHPGGHSEAPDARAHTNQPAKPLPQPFLTRRAPAIVMRCVFLSHSPHPIPWHELRGSGLSWPSP